MVAQMKSKKAARAYMNRITQGMLGSSEGDRILLTREWANAITDQQGVYLVFAKDTLVYVGESGCIRKRMVDLLDSRHHQLRRNIGDALFRNRRGFKKASSKDKFPPQIEKLLETYIRENLKVVAFPIYLGRAEIEEHIYEAVKPVYNKKGRRT